MLARVAAPRAKTRTFPAVFGSSSKLRYFERGLSGFALEFYITNHHIDCVIKELGTSKWYKKTCSKEPIFSGELSSFTSDPLEWNVALKIFSKNISSCFLVLRKVWWWVTTSVCGIYAGGVWRYQHNGYIPSSQLAAQSIFDPRHFIFPRPHIIINRLFGIPVVSSECVLL